MKTCFFIGHRDTPETICDALNRTIERHIVEEGVAEFIVGNHGRFDFLAAQAVRSLKGRYPDVTLLLLLSHYPINRLSLAPGFDGTFYPQGMETVPKRLAILRANRYMVDHSSHLIAYAPFPASNARKLIEYAQKREAAGLMKITRISVP